MTPVAITGLGCISALGNGVDSHWQALRAGKSAIAPLSGFEETGLNVATAAQVIDYKPEEHFPQGQLGLLDRHSQFALMAAREATEDAGMDGDQRAGLAAVIGTGCGGKETDELTYQKLYKEAKHRVHPFTIPRGMPSAASSQISMDLGIRGPSFTVASACASANHAIAQAVLMIRSGMVDAAIAGGTDAPFTYGLLKSWEALRVLSPETCRPFCKDRKGLVLGEGAGMLVLESLAHAQARGAHIHALITGVGMSADAAHITDPSSEGAAHAMRAALKDAGRKPEEIDYINAHGTGTQLNDLSETRAIHTVFGHHAKALPVSSTKSMHGHALGAAGALELVATVKALQEGLVPPTVNFTEPGEGCDLDYVPNEPVHRDLACAMSNSFAFGGLNAVVIVERSD
jgi:nodulation protein E